MSMLLHTLLRGLDPALNLDGVPNCTIRSVQDDSRSVQAGDLFVARPGSKQDGSKYASDAAARGALAIVTQHPIAACSLPQVTVPDAAAAASILANVLANHPSHKLKVVGITGTNGKTTTTYLLRHILTRAKIKCGVIGTVEIDDGQNSHEADMTTPSAVEVPRLLAAMRDNGCKACAMEVSSHALDQRRCAGVRFGAAGFTNLTGDHLDYHKTPEDYAAAKARLFESLEEGAVALVNDASPWTWRMLRDCKAQVSRFGFTDDAHYRARDHKITPDGTHFILHTPDGHAEVHMALVGRHNIENALLAAGLACELFGLSVHQVAAALRDAKGAPGRLQSIRCGQPFAVLVDYAHTDDALQNVLSALRPLCKGKLRVLFGCGGDRDASKRPRMAAVAKQLADVIYVTSDNPRTEDPRSIIDQIRAGLTTITDRNAKVHEEVDRRTAIEQILRDARHGDIVLLAGKGHENYQIIGAEKLHFDDAEEAARVLQSRAGSFLQAGA